MEKSVVFVSGSQTGVNRFEDYIKSRYKVKNFNANNDNNYLPKLDLENVDSYVRAEMFVQQCPEVNSEVAKFGEEIGSFLRTEKDILVVHKSSAQVRKALCAIEDRVGVNVFRIYFDESGNGEIPSEYDYSVLVDSGNFLSRILNILNNMEKIVDHDEKLC